MSQIHLWSRAQYDIINNITNNIFSRFAQIGIVAGKQFGGAGSGFCIVDALTNYLIFRIKLIILRLLLWKNIKVDKLMDFFGMVEKFLCMQ